MDRIARNYYLTQLIGKRDNGRVKVILKPIWMLL